MYKICLLFLALWPVHLMAHGFDESEIEIPSTGVKISGTLTIPAHAHSAMPLVILIAGSGPTDRDCNQEGAKTDAFKKMAHQFAMNGIASFRYDKRGVGKSQLEVKDEASLRFDHIVDDAKAVRVFFEPDTRFKNITLIGHSEGSLVGMLASKAGSKYISIAGPGYDAAKVLKGQLKGKLGALEEPVMLKLDSLTQGMTVECPAPQLMTLFRPSVQPYLMSWFKYDPSKEIKKLSGPVLIINGDWDLQVKVEQAQQLAKAKPDAQLLVVEKMNHVLVELNAEGDNMASYNKPELPISKKMMDAVILFIIKS